MRKTNGKMDAASWELSWKRLLTVLMSLALFASGKAEAQWLSGYSYRNEITINANHFEEDVSNFPLYLNVADSRLQYADHCSQVKNSEAFDIAFSDGMGTRLDHYIVSYDSASSTYRAWVNVPSISSSTDTQIYMFTGRRGIADPSTTTTWAARNHLAVWDFDFDDIGFDESPNLNVLTTSGTSTSGFLGEALSFDGSTQNASRAYDVDFDFGTTDFTISGWMKMQKKSTPATSIIQTSTTNSGWMEEAVNTDGEIFTASSSLQIGRNTASFNDFFYVGMKFDAVNVPEGSVIQSAHLEFTAANENSSGLAQFSIYADNTMSPADLSTNDSITNTLTRNLSPSSIVWNPYDWTVGETYQSSDISEILQELVDNPGWDGSSRDVVLVVDGFGLRTASSNSVELVVNFEDPTANSTASFSVSETGDDIEEQVDSNLTSAGDLTFNPAANNWIATRFTNVTVPNGAIVDSVKVQFTARETSVGPAAVVIYREDAYSSLVYQLTPSEISDRSKRGAVTWNVEDWVGDSNYETVDIGALFSDFFTNEEWVEGNDISIIFNPLSGTRRATHRGQGAAFAPQLLVFYRIAEGQPQTLISRHSGNDGGFELWGNPAGKLAFGIDNADGTSWDEDLHVTSLLAVDDQQWHHFAAVKEGEEGISLFVDGNLNGKIEVNSDLEVAAITEGANDAEETSGGNNIVASINLELGTQEVVGLRFESLSVPNGATIEEAYLQIYSNTANTDQCRVEIYADNRGTLAAFSGALDELSNNLANNGTDASVEWDIPSFSATRTAFDSPDLSAIIQEIVDGSWNEDDHMVFYLSTMGDPGERRIRSFDNDPAAAPVLFVQYRLGDFGSISGATPIMYLGDDGSGTRNMLGAVDEFRLQNSALSSAEISAQYANLTESDFVSISSSSDSVTWIGATSQEWVTPSNWNTNLSPWENMDFLVSSAALNPFELNAGIVAGHIAAETGVELNLNNQRLQVDCGCVVGDIQNGVVEVQGDSVIIGSPESVIRIDELRLATNSNSYLLSNVTIVEELDVADGARIYANAQDIVFAQPSVYAPAYSPANTIVLGSSGSLTIQNVANMSSAIFQVSYDSAARSFARVDLTNTSGAMVDYTVSLCDDVFVDGTCGGTPISSNKVNTTWFVTNSNPTGSTDMTLYWNEGNESTGFSRLSAEVNHYGTAWELLGNPASIDLGDANHATTASGVSSFSPFGISSSDAPLPVELVNFSAKIENGKIVLEWITASELNNDYFIIEKSFDGERYHLLQHVDGNGNSSMTVNYNFLDKNPADGFNFYRLTQVDFDGSATGLGTQLVAFDQDQEFNPTLYPNPIRDKVFISNLQRGAYFAQLMGLDGSPVEDWKLKIDNRSQVEQLDLTKFPVGIYVLNLTNGLRKFSRKIFIK